MRDDEAAAELVRAAGQGDPGSVRAEVANAMVAMKKKFYGRGPESAKAWILDNYVFVAMEGGLTRAEETLLADGKADQVRAFRLEFQETMTGPVTAAVEQLVGRRVLTYHSQIVFDPTHTFEMFVLEPER